MSALAHRWTHAETRAWVERHGGNISALARRLQVPRTQLHAWLADPADTERARPVPPYIQAHMETLDECRRQAPEKT